MFKAWQGIQILLGEKSAHWLNQSPFMNEFFFAVEFFCSVLSPWQNIILSFNENRERKKKSSISVIVSWGQLLKSRFSCPFISYCQIIGLTWDYKTFLRVNRRSYFVYKLCVNEQAVNWEYPPSLWIFKTHSRLRLDSHPASHPPGSTRPSWQGCSPSVHPSASVATRGCSNLQLFLLSLLRFPCMGIFLFFPSIFV